MVYWYQPPRSCRRTPVSCGSMEATYRHTYTEKDQRQALSPRFKLILIAVNTQKLDLINSNNPICPYRDARKLAIDSYMHSL